MTLRQIIRESIESVGIQKTPLFCYGSLNPTELSDWLEPEPGFFYNALSAKLHGYKRAFRGYSPRWRGGTVTAVPCKKSVIDGFVVFLSPEQTKIIDERELCPWKHTREMEIVDTVRGPMEVQLYLSTSPYYNSPTKQYLEEINDTIKFSRACK